MTMQAEETMKRRREPINRPEWVGRLMDAKRTFFETMTPAEQAEAREQIAMKREAAKARKIASAARLRRILDLSLNGHTLSEIALSEERRPSAVYQFAASKGVHIPITETTVRRVATITIDAERALRAAAADYRTTAENTLTDLLTFALADDGAILRRILHIRRKEAA